MQSEFPQPKNQLIIYRIKYSSWSVGNVIYRNEQHVHPWKVYDLICIYYTCVSDDDDDVENLR